MRSLLARLTAKGNISRFSSPDLASFLDLRINSAEENSDSEQSVLFSRVRGII